MDSGYERTIIERFMKNMPGELKRIIGYIRDKCPVLGLEAYIVGGSVRDMLLGVPNLDIDVTIVGDAQNLIRDLRANCRYDIVFHRLFNTMTLRTGNAGSIDIATARRETYAYPAALPEVHPSGLWEDLFRRDFTINSMAISLKDFTFIDPFGGMRDLRKGILRMMHDKDFIEDPTRILRGIRFAKRYGFVLEDRTENLMRVSIEKGYPARLSNDRILNELEYIMMEPQAIGMLEKAEDIGFWRTLFQGHSISPLAYERLKNIKEYKGMPYSGFGHKGLRGEETEILKGCKVPKALFEILVLMEDIGDWVLKGIFNRYGAWYKKLETYRNRERILKLPIGERALGRAELYRLFNGTGDYILEYLALTANTEQYRENVNLYVLSLRRFEFHIKGKDLEALGLEPGPRYGELLERAKLIIIERDILHRHGQQEVLEAVVKGEM